MTGNKGIALGIAAISVLCLIASLLLREGVLITLSLITMLFSLFFLRFGHILLPMITSRTRTHIHIGDYEIPPTMDAVLRRSNSNITYASVFYQIRIFESMTEKKDPETQIFYRQLENVYSTIKFPIKYSTMICLKDLSKHKDKLIRERGELELSKGKIIGDGGKEDSRYYDLQKTERKIKMIEKQLNRLVEGDKPTELISYFMVTAKGSTDREAIEKAKQLGKEASSVISSALKVETHPLAGDEMRKCFEWELGLPTSIDELHDAIW